ncbi:endolytic transglycosylase MltG [Streptomyces sp. BI20]|uniref:endolytic transglycosylase MltG n=1 Tax=Streptomyces sp. BI20 TaxID=3403460 RepID=UPI003C7941ED
MTDYGQGRGPAPWHPEDPYQGVQGQQAGQVPYAVDPQQQAQAHYGQYPQQPGGYPGTDGAGQAYPQDAYQQQLAYEEYARAQAVQAHAHAQAQAQGGPGWEPQPQGWDPGTGQVPDSYGQVPPAGPPGEGPDLYGTEGSYPPPQAPDRRHLVPEQASDEDGAAGAEGILPPAGGATPPPGGRRAGRDKGKGRGGKSSKAGCLVISLVLAVGVGGAGWYGYDWLKGRFGTAEDYSGKGEGEIEIEIPQNATLAAMGRILKEHGVVASVEAFTRAASVGRGTSIQPGVYTLRKKMSAISAVALMTDPSALNTIIVREGVRNVEVYKDIDKRLKLSEGTTAGVAKKESKNLGLPSWAGQDPQIKDPLEGFLYPSRYDLSKTSTPESVLKSMVARAKEKYDAAGIVTKAKELKLDNPLQVVSIASLVQAEGMSHDDFRKMAEVVYNRLKPDNQVTFRLLQMDSTINYIKGTSDINVSVAETRKIDDPYNTYNRRGLMPGPIGNPGDEALSATLNPDGGGWMFFVSVDGKKTVFTKTLSEHDELVREFNARQAEKKQNSGG